MTACTCPICACDWPAQPLRCVCGYDFETGSTQEAMRSLMIQQRAATRRWLSGVITFSSAAVTFVAASIYPMVMLILPLVVAVQVLLGLGLVVNGLARGLGIGRQLAKAKSLHQLPEARLLR